MAASVNESAVDVDPLGNKATADPLMAKLETIVVAAVKVLLLEVALVNDKFPYVSAVTNCVAPLYLTILDEPNVFVPPPETVIMEDVPVRLKAAPFATLKFFVLANALTNPPLFNIPVWTLRLPVTFKGVMPALKVAPDELVLLTLILL